jgi:hypothetical protein
MRTLPALAFAVAVGLSGFSPAAFAVPVGNGDSKVGQACTVTAGPNKGRTGTYTMDVDGLNCAGDWGSTGCADNATGGSKCADATRGPSRFPGGVRALPTIGMSAVEPIPVAPTMGAPVATHRAALPH